MEWKQESLLLFCSRSAYPMCVYPLPKVPLCLLRKLWSLNCLWKCIFCKFVLTSARNLSLLKQFTYMHPKDLVTHFQKMVIVYYAIAYCFGDVRVWIRRILLNFCWVSTFFDILIAIFSWMVAQTIIFWKSVMKTFRCNK